MMLAPFSKIVGASVQAISLAFMITEADVSMKNKFFFALCALYLVRFVFFVTKSVIMVNVLFVAAIRAG